MSVVICRASRGNAGGICGEPATHLRVIKVRSVRMAPGRYVETRYPRCLEHYDPAAMNIKLPRVPV